MELQKRLQINRQLFENKLRAYISANHYKLGYSYNDQNVFLWGDESLIRKLKAQVQI